ncbi:AraC family transcriptional regulator [Cupriavidus sp. WKF15]|uniref:helix-turn-helix transcriptional regulator n=1 Tax=Cupriavidus sp. WKF15 TaxID=3032282 RepID=UPI0023E30CB6|nr:AraC family transcriptional regulator [Cupriavidus sp. WKF15]WER49040.1 AraC family transcriptional regulator [Cupriavidus sp. WKF15]
MLATTVSGTVPAIPSTPRYGSGAFHWDGFVLERHLLAAGTLDTTVMPVHCLAIPVNRHPVPIRWHLNGRRLDGAMAPNRVYFRAAGDALSSAWSAPLDAVYFSVQPDAVVLAHEQTHERRAQDLRSDFAGAADSGLVQLVLTLDAHVKGGSVGGSLFEQSLLLAISLRVGLLYGANGRNTTTPAVAPQRGLLPRHTLARLDDFIFAHLSQPLTIEAIAAAVHISPFHLCRMFRKTRQVSLWQYVLMCRIEYARKLIRRHPDMPLADVATASGFDSYTQFFAAFRKFSRTSPSDFRGHAGAPASQA